MLNFILMTDKDRKEAAAIERRRMKEEERKKRIFNPRTRLFGIDQEGLDRQIMEKQKRDSEEKRVKDLYDEQMVKNDKIALAYEQKEKEERAKYLKEIDDFRLHYQRPEDRREFDLNDPNWKKKSLPARLGDNDPRLGPSSVQKFEGEDLMSEARLKVQREQIRAWLDQQMQERDAAEKEQKDADEAYKAAVMARDKRAIELDEMEKECRKRLQEANRRFNLALAAEKEFEKRVKNKQNTEDNLAEIYNTLMSDMMTENPEVAQSNLGPSRQIGFMYKGMTPQQREEIRNYQLAQIEEKKARDELEKRRNQEYDDYFNGTQMTISLMDLDLKRKERARLKQMAEENQKMAEEHKNHEMYMKKIVFTNRPTAAYYDQFNRSTR